MKRIKKIHAKLCIQAFFFFFFTATLRCIYTEFKILKCCFIITDLFEFFMSSRTKTVLHTLICHRVEVTKVKMTSVLLLSLTNWNYHWHLMSISVGNKLREDIKFKSKWFGILWLPVISNTQTGEWQSEFRSMMRFISKARDQTTSCSHCPKSYYGIVEAIQLRKFTLHECHPSLLVEAPAEVCISCSPPC